ncbi:hypothetical protein D3C80_2085190 [compost metagenome]
MIVDGLTRDTRRDGDLVDAGAGKAFPTENIGRGLQDREAFRELPFQGASVSRGQIKFLHGPKIGAIDDLDNAV